MESNTPEISKQTKKGIKNFIHNLFDIRGDTMPHKELQEMMEENTIIHGSNMWILMLAILIASIGLNVNSTAVIIGAMLISPLMSGILTMGYSLATGDLLMLKKSSTSFGSQVIISLITSTIYFLITPLDVATSEMIARTSPTLWDVLIALFGGIAGMIGNTRQKKSNVIPGVAIATALMPPLCTAGYGIATMQLQFLIGAFYLFAINTLFIMLSAAFVTKLLKIPHHNYVDPKKQKKINRLITSITVVTVIPSILIGAFTVLSTVVERNITNYLNNEFVFPDTQMVQSSTDHAAQTISVSLVGATVSDEVIERISQELPRYNLENYTLHVTQNKLSETDSSDKVTITIQENMIKELQIELEEQKEQNKQLLTDAQEARERYIDCKAVSQKVATVFTKLQNCECGIMNGEYLLFTASTYEPFNETEEQVLCNLIKSETKITNCRLQINVKKSNESEVNPDT